MVDDDGVWEHPNRPQNHVPLGRRRTALTGSLASGPPLWGSSTAAARSRRPPTSPRPGAGAGLSRSGRTGPSPTSARCPPTASSPAPSRTRPACTRPSARTHPDGSDAAAPGHPAGAWPPNDAAERPRTCAGRRPARPHVRRPPTGWARHHRVRLQKHPIGLPDDCLLRGCGPVGVAARTPIQASSQRGSTLLLVSFKSRSSISPAGPSSSNRRRRRCTVRSDSPSSEAAARIAQEPRPLHELRAARRRSRPRPLTARAA